MCMYKKQCMSFNLPKTFKGIDVLFVVHVCGYWKPQKNVQWNFDIKLAYF